MAKKSRKQQQQRRQQQNKSKSIQQQQKLKKLNSIVNNNDDETIDLLSDKLDGVKINTTSSSSTTTAISSIIGKCNQLSNKPSGLPNIGNTCYFNSVMQVIAQTYLLHHCLRERCQQDYRWTARTFYWNDAKKSFISETLQNLSLQQSPNSLTINFLQLQQKIFQQQSTNPRLLLHEIQREKQQFEGFAQQDAHELLITLLDSLKKSEIIRQMKALLNGLNIDNNKPNDNDRQNAKNFKITAKHTVIDSIFGGQLLSIVHCMVCDYRSFTFEPFIDLSLPLDTKIFSSSSTLTNQKQSKKMRKNVIISDDVSDEDIEQNINDNINNNDDDNKSLANRKKRRQEKKAARRAERKQMKQLKQQQQQKQNDNDDEIQEKSSNNQDDDDDEELINGESGKQCINDNNTTTLLSGDVLSDDDDDEIIDDSISNSIDNSIDNDNNKKNDKKIIDDEFRYKFHLFAHQTIKTKNNFDNNNNMDLGKLFENFFKEELLDDKNKYLCDNCTKLNNGEKCYSKAKRCQLIAIPPPILILQLKRFEASGGFSNRSRNMYKLNTKILFPYRLYLSPYTSRIYEYFSKFYEPNLLNHNNIYCDDRILQYTLYAVVIHSGSLKSGHYMAYVCVRPHLFQCNYIEKFLHLKPFVSDIDHIMQFVHQQSVINNNNDDGNINHNTDDTDIENDDTDNTEDDEKNRKWYLISDSSVTSITLETVLRDATSPYMLFYERTH